jgi:SAM-dependent methyltransferase
MPVVCKICGGRCAFISSIVDGQRPGNDECYRCDECGLVFVGNTPTQDQLESAYDHVSEQYYASIERETRQKFAAAIRELKQLGVEPEASILDIGAGNGWFVETLLESGYTHLFAHEVPGADLTRLRKVGIQVFNDFDYSSLPSNRFDLITLFDVAEHVTDPHYLFRECHRVLSPGGLLYFHTPMVTPVDHVMHAVQKIPIIAKVGKMWQRSRLSVYHLQNYSVRSLHLVLEKAGFVNLKIRKENELSWPVSRYVRVYITRDRAVLRLFSPFITAALYPMVATRALNPNKGIVIACK